MRPEVSWIDRVGTGLVGIMPRPRGVLRTPIVPKGQRGGDWLDGEIQALSKSGVNVVVSLLTADEVAELELHDEERLCGDSGLRFISLPIPDRSVPFSMPEAGRALDLILDELWTGKAVAVHCRMGIGRSALVAACLLKSQGIGVDEAFATISRARGFSVPDTEEQREWVKGFAEFRRGVGRS